ncbi:MAG: hypothetical protein AAGA02_02735 [Bacteroidota bacterium]
MKQIRLLLFWIVLFVGGLWCFTACNNDDDPVVEPSAEELRLREGYLVLGSLDGSTLVQYYNELPTGTVDVTQGTDFQEFFPTSVINSTIYTITTDGSNGIEKIIVNESGQLQIVGEISTVDFVRSLSVRDSLLGVFHDINDASTLTAFNPTTMEVTGSIDMSIVSELGREEGEIGYGGFAFRGQNEMIVALDATPRLPGAPRAIIDLNTMRATSITTFEEGNLLNPPIIVTNSHFDENGNYYGPNFSSEGIPTVSGTILKIPAGQDSYDPLYNFQVPLQNNPQQLALGGSFLTAFEYYGNNKGLAVINESLPPRVIEIVFVENGGDFDNIDQNELNEILTLLTTSPTAIVAEVDMVTQAITKVEGVPSVRVFGGAGLVNIDNQAYFILRSEEANGLYRHLGGTSAELVFEGTGATMAGVIDLSQDYQ